MLAPAMEREGYTRRYAAAITAASSVIGPNIPPPGSMSTHASVLVAGVGAVFIWGLLPGMMVGVGAVVAAVPRRLAIEAHPAVARVRGAVDGALVRGDFTALLPLLSPNVDQDERLSRRAAVRSLPVPRTRASPQREKGRSRDGRSSPASAPRPAR